MVEERNKRALPARHNFLTDAVCSVLESQSKIQDPQVDSRTMLKLDQDTTHCTDHGGPTPPPLPSSDTRPIFRILPQRRPIKSKNSTALSDDYYTARHRKHEMEEKKQKNREKERLEHELYQQQQLVERLKTLDKSTLASIVSSLRNGVLNNSNDNNCRSSSSSSYTTMTTSELERLHQTILRDAREQVYRYEQLGLGRKRGQGFAAQQQPPPQHQQHRVSPEVPVVKHHHPHRLAKENIPLTPPPPPPPPLEPHSPPPSPPSSSSSSSSLHAKKQTPPSVPTTRTTTVSLEKKKSMATMVLAHFKSHRQPSSGGKRKSLRTAIAFGEKIPAMDDIEFYLPDDLFGDLKMQRSTKERQHSTTKERQRTTKTMESSRRRRLA